MVVMNLLVVESRTGIATEMIERLQQAEHEVVMCADAQSDGPCRSVRTPADCPLNSHVDLCVVVRACDESDSLLEMGAVCAERHRTAVVRVDPANVPDVDLFVRRAAAAGRDIAEAEYASIVREALSDAEAKVEAERSPGRVLIRLVLPDRFDRAQRAALADRARAVIRDFDVFVPTIDIAVTPAST